MPTVVVSRLVAGNKRFSLRIGTASFQHRANKRTAAGREVSGSSVIPIAYMAHNIPVAMTFRIIAPNLKNIKQNRTCHGFTRVLVSVLLFQQFTLRARPPSHHCILKKCFSGTILKIQDHFKIHGDLRDFTSLLTQAQISHRKCESANARTE